MEERDLPASSRRTVSAYSSRRTRAARVLLKSTPGSSGGWTTGDAYESKLSG
jgi:hypothetical protein